MTWPDGSTVKVFNAGGLGSGVLDVSLALSTDRLGHVEGLLGTAGVPAAKEFPGANGRLYPPSVITGTSRHDANVRYGQFGASWRITQHESLFRYTDGNSTRSYTVPGFLATYESVASLPARTRAAAEKACKAAGITSGQLLDACELDVARDGRQGLRGGRCEFAPRRRQRSRVEQAIERRVALVAHAVARSGRREGFRRLQLRRQHERSGRELPRGARSTVNGRPHDPDLGLERSHHAAAAADGGRRPAADDLGHAQHRRQ